MNKLINQIRTDLPWLGKGLAKIILYTAGSIGFFLVVGTLVDYVIGYGSEEQWVLFSIGVLYMVAGWLIKHWYIFLYIYIWYVFQKFADRLEEAFTNIEEIKEKVCGTLIYDEDE